MKTKEHLRFLEKLVEERIEQARERELTEKIKTISIDAGEGGKTRYIPDFYNLPADFPAHSIPIRGIPPTYQEHSFCKEDLTLYALHSDWFNGPQRIMARYKGRRVYCDETHEINGVNRYITSQITTYHPGPWECMIDALYEATPTAKRIAEVNVLSQHDKERVQQIEQHFGLKLKDVTKKRR